MRFSLSMLVLACLTSPHTHAQSTPILIPSPTSVEGARFGTSVAEYRAELNSTRLAVGAPFGSPGENTAEQPGRVYIYSGNPSNTAPVDSLQSAAPMPGDLFGFSLGAEPIEMILAVGAPGASSASVYDSLRERRFDLITPGQRGDQFGYSVDVNHGFMVGGAPGNDGGAVYVWTTNFFDTEGPIRLNPTDSTDREFGSAVSITSWAQNATRLVVGAPGGDGSGSVYVYYFVEEGLYGEGIWIEEARLTGPSGFGKGVDLLDDGEILVITARDALYFYGRNEGKWILADSLAAPADRLWFGRSAALGFPRGTPDPTGSGWDVFWTGTASEPETAQPLSACRQCTCRGCSGTSDPSVQVEFRALPVEATRAFGASVTWNPYASTWSRYAPQEVLVGDPLAGGTGALFAYSDPNIVIVPIEAGPERGTLDQVEVWPNPTSRRLHIRYKANSLEPVVVSLVDVLGREATSVVPSVGLEKDDRSISLDVSRLPSGLYFVVLRTATRSVSRTITIVH